MLTLRESRRTRESIMPHAALKLVATDPVDRDVLRFERRQVQRRPIGGRVTSLQKSTDDSLTRNRIGSLQLLDISDTGMGATVDESIRPGTTIVVFFSSHGVEPGFDRFGHVVRCTKCDKGYRIGIRLSNKSAA